MYPRTYCRCTVACVAVGSGPYPDRNVCVYGTVVQTKGRYGRAHTHFWRMVPPPKPLPYPMALGRLIWIPGLLWSVASALPVALVPGGLCSDDDDCGGLHGRGSCLAAVCACAPSWTGADCSASTCPRGCSGHGSCIGPSGVCACDDGYAGAGCDVPSLPCPHECSGHGHGCLAGGPCVCDVGFAGADCSRTVCHAGEADYATTACSGHGHCGREGVCVCDEGYGGGSCEDALCVDGCNGHGHCAAPGRCVCAGGWSGARTSSPLDPTAACVPLASYLTLVRSRLSPHDTIVWQAVRRRGVWVVCGAAASGSRAVDAESASPTARVRATAAGKATAASAPDR